MHNTIPIYSIVSDHIKSLLINKFKLSNVKHSLEYTICKRVYYEWIEYGIGIYAKEVYNKVKDKIKNKQKLKKFYAILDKLANAGVINKEKKEGYLILSVPKSQETILLNLIKYMQNSNSEFVARLRSMEGVLKGNPKLIRDYAITEFINKNNLDVVDREKLLGLFLKYLSAIENRTIVLYNKQKQKLLKIPYKTRFNSGKRLYEKIDQFYSLFENAASKYKDAVFLTLTLDAKRFKNIHVASKHVSQALNRFISYLKKKSKNKISYINVFEFNKSGMVHLHMVFFGFKWLLSQKTLSNLWNKYGMGKIVYLYSLKYDEEYMGYVFHRKRPKNTDEKDVSNYLIKYLKKAFYNKSELALYWLTNKRFYTYSRDLKEKKEEKRPIGGGWEYIGVFDKDLFNNLDDEEFINLVVNVNVDKYLRKLFGRHRLLPI